MIHLLLKFCQKKFAPLLLYIAVIAAAGGCDAEEPCTSNELTRFIINFYGPGEDDENVEQEFYFDSIAAVGAQVSAFIPEAGIGVNSLGLSLNPQADTTTYIFYYEGDQQDTLQLTYNRNFRMISPDCELEISFTDIVMLQQPFNGYENISVSFISDEISDENREPNLDIVSSVVCTPEETSRLTIGFYQPDEGGGEAIAVSRNFRRVTRVGNDEVYFAGNSGGAGTKTISINLDPSANEATFIFENFQGSPDTLALSYTRKFPVETVLCAPDIRYENIQLLPATTFDEVQISTTAIPDPTQQINVKIIDQ